MMMLGAFGAMQSLLGMSSRPADMPANSANITSNPAVQQFIERGMSFLPSWMQVDMSMLVAIFFVAGYMWQPLMMLSESFYWAVVRFFTASISITPSDRLNIDVVQYISTEVIPKGGSRVLTARSEYIGSRNRYRVPLSELANVGTKDPITDGRVKPIDYLPGFQTMVFRFGWNIMMVTRVADKFNTASDRPKEYSGAPTGDEPVVIMCLGRSIEPIKRFLEHCREFNAHRRDQWVAVRIPRSDHDYSGEGVWDEPIMRPARPLSTVHFDEKDKKDLVDDIRQYLDPATKRFYLTRGIPYRRGYLMHGPPGTGKSSLSLALASLCQLDLYLLHLPSLGFQGDRLLARLFQALPARCIVLIEDIDAVGLRRDIKKPDANLKKGKNKNKNNNMNPPMPGTDLPPTCTLSGLLNVLDGVASQEGRIVLMTSNHPEKLDPALIRPGRIDKRVYLGHVDADSASSMFMRMFAIDASPAATTPADSKPSEPAPALLAWDSSFVRSEIREMRLATMAAKFAAQVPEKTFTPAQLQGFLLKHRGMPEEAVSEVVAWVPAEQAAMKEAEEWKKKYEQELLEEWEAMYGDGGDDDDDDKKKKKSDEKDEEEGEKEEGKDDEDKEGKEEGDKEGKKDKADEKAKSAESKPAKDKKTKSDDPDAAAPPTADEPDAKPPKVNSKVARRKTEPLDSDSPAVVVAKKPLPNGVKPVENGVDSSLGDAADKASSVETRDDDDVSPTPVDSD